MFLARSSGHAAGEHPGAGDGRLVVGAGLASSREAALWAPPSLRSLAPLSLDPRVPAGSGHEGDPKGHLFCRHG